MSTKFTTFADHIEAGRRGTLVMFDRPDAEELAMLVMPYTYLPNIAELLDESNWEAICSQIGAAAKRVDRARRHIRHMLIPHVRNRPNRPVVRFAQDVCNGSYAVGSGPEYVNRLHSLVDIPPIDGETVASFASRLDDAREQDDYKVVSFGHWATPYDLMLVRPGSKAHETAVELADRLENYPVLDEEDFSNRECESQYQSVLDELGRLDLESNGEPLSPDALGDLASEICQASNENQDYDQSDVTEALGELGWVVCEDDVWRPADETEDSDPAPFCRCETCTPGDVTCVSKD